MNHLWGTFTECPHGRTQLPCDRNGTRATPQRRGAFGELLLTSACIGLPLWLSWKRICLQCGRPGFDPWVRKIPWRRKSLPTPVFLPGEFHRERSQASRAHAAVTESDTMEWLTLVLSNACIIYSIAGVPGGLQVWGFFFLGLFMLDLHGQSWTLEKPAWTGSTFSNDTNVLVWRQTCPLECSLLSQPQLTGSPAERGSPTWLL